VLREAARNAPGTAKPLRQLLQTLDDRRRAVENDPRAKATAPPAPDKTHIPASRQGGFTGMEGLWNYYYWQALSTNAYDAVGHILRISATLDLTGCSAYQTTITEETMRCQRWLGPHQPGVNRPDPTEIRREQGDEEGMAARGRAPAPRRRTSPPAPPPPGQTVATKQDNVLLGYLLGP
jgi:hypothetical protein